VTAILNHRCEYVAEMTVIMKRRWECKDRMLSQSKILFERAMKLKQLSSKWPPALAARTLQALMSGLIVLAVEREKCSGLAREGVACVEAFFRSIKAD
jgi:hypothetical protein